MTRRTSIARKLCATGLALASLAVLTAAMQPAMPRAAVALDNVQRASATPNAVYGFGGAPALGANDDGRLVGIAPMPDGNGYWVVNRRGRVTGYGNAPFLGDVSTLPITRPIVGIAALPPGLGVGYWLTSDDGGVFSFGAAQFRGSMGGVRLNNPVVGIAAGRHGGYWLASSDGGIFSFGEPFLGSMGGIRLNNPVVGITAGRNGYWMVSNDGGVFSFGERFYGSTGGIRLLAPITGIAATPAGRGYWLVSSDGGLFSFGNAPYRGNAFGGTWIPIAGIASRPRQGGYWMLAGAPGPRVSPRAIGNEVPAGTGAGRRVVYCNSCQRVWLVEDDGGWDVTIDSYLVSGRQGWPAPGWYGVQRRLNPGYTENGVRLDYFVGFAWGTSTDIGFHGIPVAPNGQPLQSESELGQFRSHGCVRQALRDAAIMWDFAQPGTPVLVLR